MFKDAHEFLCQVLDQLKEEFDKLNKKLEHRHEVVSNEMTATFSERQKTALPDLTNRSSSGTRASSNTIIGNLASSAFCLR